MLSGAISYNAQVFAPLPHQSTQKLMYQARHPQGHQRPAGGPCAGLGMGMVIAGNGVSGFGEAAGLGAQSSQSTTKADVR